MRHQEDDSVFLNHAPCPACGSSDALGVFSDGHTYCYSCEKWTPGTGANVNQERRPKVAADMITGGTCMPLGKRRISQETCEKFDYQVAKDNHGTVVQVAPYYKGGVLVGQKVRTPDKEFYATGDMKGVELFGQHLWKDGGKRVVITEGEIDALTVSQAFGNKWPVVSVPGGAQGALKALQCNLEWCEKFAEIVLGFDDDDPGRSAVSECAALFTPGKVKVATWDGAKDANELLQTKGALKDVAVCVYNAKEWRPDGIVCGSDLKEAVRRPIVQGLSYPWETLTKALYGIRTNEIITMGAGTGMGKSDFYKEVAVHLMTTHGQKVGLVFLEESTRDTALHLMGKYAGRLFHIPGTQWTVEEFDAADDAILGSGRAFFYDHFGGTAYDQLRAKLRYLAVSCGCKYIFLDHVTALVSGDREIDERRELDFIMTDLASLVRELDITLFLISHLKRPEGKPHEEGGRVMLGHFRGSAAICQWSSYVIGLERNQQDPDPDTRRTSIIRVLKDRYTGRATGTTMALLYGCDTGKLKEVPIPSDDPKDKDKKQRSIKDTDKAQGEDF